jgi:hypothetical protein
MKIQNIKVLTIILSLTIFIISLTQNAIVTSRKNYTGNVNYTVEVNTTSSLALFFSGSIAFLGGGAAEEIIWLANPLSLISIIMLIKNNKKSRLTSSIALILAFTFIFWKEILANEGGGVAKIISLELGYYLWVLSIIVLNIGLNLYFYKSKEL